MCVGKGVRSWVKEGRATWVGGQKGKLGPMLNSCIIFKATVSKRRCGMIKYATLRPVVQRHQGNAEESKDMPKSKS